MMNTHDIRRTIAIRYAALLLATSVASSAPTFAEGDAGTDALAAKQRTVEDRLNRLEDRLFRVREALSATDPESAQRLEQAIKQLGELQIKGDVAAVLEMIETGRFDEASDKQKQVLENLRAVLTVLIEHGRDPDKDRERREQLEAFRKQLSEIITEQRGERQASRQAEKADEFGKLLADATESIKKLVRQQEELGRRTQTAGQESPTQAAKDLGRTQNKIRKDAEAQSFSLDELAEAMGEKRRPPEPDDEEAERKGPISAAGRDLAESAERMTAAEKALADGSFKKANEQQAAALEEMRRALKRLTDEQEKLNRPPDFPKQAADQRATQKKTGQLAQQMGRQTGNQQPKQAGQSGKPGKEPTPGQKRVAQAEKQMDDAAKDLDKQQPAKAGLEQNKALDELKAAKDELDEVIQQLRKEEQEQILRDLAARFQTMLKKQMSVNLETARLHELGSQNWKRAEELKLAALSKEQHALGNESMKALELLTEEGSTAVFPRVVQAMAEDMYFVSDRLAAAKLGTVTRQIQKGIVQTLKELLDAIEQQSGGGGGGGDGGGGGGGGSGPLVPGSAELKLLRSMQIRVNRQTEALGDADQPEPAPLKKLSDRQLDISDMAKEMHERTLKQR